MGLKSIRQTFKPDPGCVFVRCDLSQVEDRVCKMYCGTPRMVELANRHPDEYDAHTDNARRIFKKQKISKDERYLGKRTTHASQRGMRGKRLAENILKDTEGKLVVTDRQCDRMIDNYLDNMWEIRDIYFPWVRKQIIDHGVLKTSWGRRWDVRGYRIDQDLFRKGYSFFMQAEAADWTNQYLFYPTWMMMRERYGKSLNLQVHDEVVASVPFEDVYDTAFFMQAAAQQTREIPKGSGNKLTVPAEVTVGLTWYGGVEFSRLPEREEFNEKVKEGLEL